MKTIVCCLVVGFAAFMLGGAKGYQDGYAKGSEVSESLVVKTCMAFWFGGDERALQQAMNNYCKANSKQFSSFKVEKK